MFLINFEKDIGSYTMRCLTVLILLCNAQQMKDVICVLFISKNIFISIFSKIFHHGTLVSATTPQSPLFGFATPITGAEKPLDFSVRVKPHIYPDCHFIRFHHTGLSRCINLKSLIKFGADRGKLIDFPLYVVQI